MAQELKSNLQPVIIDTYTHVLSRNINYVAIHSQVCFHRRLFADRVKLHCCITGPVGPLGRTNQSWYGVKLLTMSVSTHPVDCVHICHLLRDSTTLCTLMVAFSHLQLATHPTPPGHPYTTHPPPIH